MIIYREREREISEREIIIQRCIIELIDLKKRLDKYSEEFHPK